MSVNYYEVFHSDVALGLDDDSLGVIAGTRAGRRVLESLFKLEPEEKAAYQKLGHQILKNVAGPEFAPGPRPAAEITEDELDYLLLLAEGNEDYYGHGIGIHRKAVLNKDLKDKYQAPNLSNVLFKSILERSVLVSPRPSAGNGFTLAPVLYEALALIAAGKTTDEMGHELDTTSTSAGQYVKRLLLGLHASSRPHAVYRSFEIGLWPNSLEPITD